MNELIEFSLDTENGEKNYNLAQWYENQGHTAPAHTYYLRAAERTEDDILAYTSLIRASFCYKSQGSRDGTEKVVNQLSTWARQNGHNYTTIKAIVYRTKYKKERQFECYNSSTYYIKEIMPL